MTSPRIVKVDDIEFRFDLVAVGMRQQMVEGYGGKVRVFVIIAIKRITLLDLLLDEVVHDCIRLTAARRTKYDCGTEGIDHVDPSVMPFLPVVETARQVHGILILNQAGLLHETLVLVVEDILHQIVLQQTAHPQTSHHQTDISDGDSEDVE